MKGQKSVQDMYDYLYGFDFLDTKYDLKVVALQVKPDKMSEPEGETFTA
jgi:hypothetical protein